jgi:hypothetical protein
MNSLVWVSKEQQLEKNKLGILQDKMELNVPVFLHSSTTNNKVHNLKLFYLKLYQL